ncbi:unnamed protein product [Amoebophrya sp. A120]|nr:unnamed protein product [Amoebophrya sp. A120]|eukprot:GSA120T00018179001.1
MHDHVILGAVEIPLFPSQHVDAAYFGLHNTLNGMNENDDVEDHDEHDVVDRSWHHDDHGGRAPLSACALSAVGKMNHHHDRTSPVSICSRRHDRAVPTPQNQQRRTTPVGRRSDVSIWSTDTSPSIESVRGGEMSNTPLKNVKGETSNNELFRRKTWVDHDEEDGRLSCDPFSKYFVDGACFLEEKRVYTVPLKRVPNVFIQLEKEPMKSQKSLSQSCRTRDNQFIQADLFSTSAGAETETDEDTIGFVTVQFHVLSKTRISLEILSFFTKTSHGGGSSSSSEHLAKNIHLGILAFEDSRDGFAHLHNAFAARSSELASFRGRVADHQSALLVEKEKTSPTTSDAAAAVSGTKNEVRSCGAAAAAVVTTPGSSKLLRRNQHQDELFLSSQSSSHSLRSGHDGHQLLQGEINKLKPPQISAPTTEGRKDHFSASSLFDSHESRSPTHLRLNSSSRFVSCETSGSSDASPTSFARTETLQPLPETPEHADEAAADTRFFSDHRTISREKIVEYTFSRKKTSRFEFLAFPDGEAQLVTALNLPPEILLTNGGKNGAAAGSSSTSNSSSARRTSPLLKVFPSPVLPDQDEGSIFWFGKQITAKYFHPDFLYDGNYVPENWL